MSTATRNIAANQDMIEPDISRMAIRSAMRRAIQNGECIDRAIKAEATALPWAVTTTDGKDLRNGITQPGHEPYIIATTHNHYAHDGSSEAEANAALIVRCVNSHDALVAALKAAQESIIRLHDNDHDYLSECDCADAQAFRQIEAALAEVQA